MRFKVFAVAAALFLCAVTSFAAIDCTTLANDPYSTGCANTGFKVNSIAYNGHTVEIWYSTGCQTNWAIVRSSSAQSLKAIVEKKGSTTVYCWFKYSPATTTWTNMIPCPTGTCQARACDLSAYYNDDTARGSKCSGLGCCTGYF
jgi:uncharacterized protein DUF2690